MTKRILLIAIICISTNVTAEPNQLSNDPRRPTEAISRDLGIKQEQFVACFQNVHPANKGERLENSFQYLSLLPSDSKIVYFK